MDGQTIADFEADLSNNLYKLWNRMSSGSYFPPPVRRVDIPKDDGKTRPLGIPTVADRVAQMVVKRFLEPLLEPQFHKDSYGYRPEKSALDAVGMARQRCWRHAWLGWSGLIGCSRYLGVAVGMLTSCAMQFAPMRWRPSVMRTAFWWWMRPGS